MNAQRFLSKIMPIDGVINMDDVKNKRIGIFEYDSSMYSFIKDYAIKLVEAGYSIDIFFKDWDIRPDFAKTSEFKLYENIRFFDFTTRPTGSQIIRRRIKRLLNKMAIYFSVKLKDKPEDIIDHNILNKSKEIISQSQYLCFIGIEKKGLIWAGVLSEIYKCPFIYYSLELYTEDNPVIYRVYHLREAEKRYHQLSIATIIQDGPRANILLKSNGVEHTNVLYFPVSVRGNIIQGKSKFLQNKFNIGDDKKILLYFGSIEKTRFVTQIVKMAGDLDDDVILVVHGCGPKKYLDYLQSIADKNKVIFSLDFVAEDEIENLISSAHIGIALYKTTNSNDRLVAFSSSKMAYYTQCGVPVIAFDTESFRELVNSYECVELINTVGEIPQKVHKILENYVTYKDQAHAAYKRFYNLDENFSKLISKFEQTIRVVESASHEDASIPVNKEETPCSE